MQILGTRRGAARTDHDLRRLLDALDPVLGGADDVWAALSPRQQTELCRHVEMRTVRDNDGDKVDEFYLGGGEIVTGEGRFGACDLFVLVRGGGRPSTPPGVGVHSSCASAGPAVLKLPSSRGGRRVDGGAQESSSPSARRIRGLLRRRRTTGTAAGC